MVFRVKKIRLNNSILLRTIRENYIWIATHFEMSTSKTKQADVSLAQRLSKNLNLLIAECGIDGVQLSKHTGIPVTTINRLRKDDPNNNPTISTLVPLADFFAINLSQLIGDEPLPATRIKGAYRVDPAVFNHLPLLSWQEAIHWPQTINENHEMIQTEHQYSDHAYALIVEEEHWENLSKGTALLIDPLCRAEHRDLTIVYKNGQALPTVKQLLFDDEQIYLKPLTYGYNISPIKPDQKILGVVVEYKKHLKNIKNLDPALSRGTRA